MNNELPVLVDTGKAYTVKYRGKYLYSSVDPVGKTLELVSQVKIKEKTLIFIPGSGLGYGIRELLQKLPPYCYIICVEADEQLFNLTLRNGELPDIKDERLIVLRTENPVNALQALHSLGVHNVRRVQRINLCASCHLFQDTYDLMLASLEKEIKNYWQNKITLLFMGRLLVKNILINLPYLAMASDLKDLYVEKPVVVVGAGPSLDQSILLLKEIREQVFILASDTALGTLMAHSITPDMVFSLEAQFFNIEDFIQDKTLDMPLLCDLSVCPQVLRLFKTVYFFSSQFSELRILDRLKQEGLLPSQIPPLGSVGIAAVYCALQMTAAPVILAGLDFSYGGKRTHSKHTIFHKLLLDSAKRFSPCENINFMALQKRPLLVLPDKTSEPVLSDLILHSYQEHLARIVSRYSERVYDLNPHGLASGARPCHDIRLLKELLGAGKKNTPPAGHRKMPERLDHYSPASLFRFLDDEEKLLDEARELTAVWLKEKKEDAGVLDEKSFAKLRAVDYTYFHLPHKIALPRYTRSLLEHINAFCRFFLTKVRQAKTALPAVSHPKS